MNARTWLTVLVLVLSLASTSTASVIINMTQSGSDVVATGSGTLDLTGLEYGGTGGAAAQIYTLTSFQPIAIFGSVSGTSIEYYYVTNTISQLGPGTSQRLASSGSGDQVGYYRYLLVVPQGYVSGSPLTTTSTWANSTFASLGVDTGTYTWSWDTDSLVLNIGGTSAVPEPSTFLLLGAGLAGLIVVKRRMK